MLYRPVPHDFPAAFIRLGWSEIKAHYRAHARTIVRWLEVCGRKELIARRAEFVRKQRERKKGNRL